MLEGKVSVKSSLDLKAKGGGRGKPFMEVKEGDSLSISRGRWMRVLQIVDRRNNRTGRSSRIPRREKFCGTSTSR